MGEAHFDGDCWRSRLREAGLRATTARLAIVRTLDDADGALSAHEVMERLEIEGMDRVTVYRTLGSLVDCGLAHKLDPGDRVWRFSLEDPNDEPHARDHAVHPHFVCDECGTILCMDNATVEVKLDQAQSERFEIREQETVLRGRCPACRANPPRAAAQPAAARPITH
ncbi:MAG: Fur family transcriptional regulator [Phycisphaerales bacterium]